jgi:hypothetical protein
MALGRISDVNILFQNAIFKEEIHLRNCMNEWLSVEEPYLRSNEGNERKKNGHNHSNSSYMNEYTDKRGSLPSTLPQAQLNGEQWSC